MNCVGHQSPGLWRAPEDRSAQLQRPRLLDRAGPLLGARPLRRHLPRRRARRLRRLRRLARRGRCAPARRCRSTTRCCWCRRWRPSPSTSASASPPTRPSSTRTRSPAACRRSTTSPTAASAGTSSPATSTARARNMGATTSSPHDAALRPSPTSTSRSPTSCGRARWEDDAVVRRPRTRACSPTRQGPPHRATTARYFRVPGHPPLRAVAAAHARALPGRRLEPRPRLSPPARRGDLRRRADQGVPARATVADIRERALARRPRPATIADLHLLDGHHRRRRRGRARRKHADDTCRYVDAEGSPGAVSGWMGATSPASTSTSPLGDITTNATSMSAVQAADDGRLDAARLRPSAAAIGGLGAARASAPAREVADELQALGRGDRRRRLQPHLRRHARHFADVVEHVVPELQRARRLQDGVRARDAARQAARSRFPTPDPRTQRGPDPQRLTRTSTTCPARARVGAGLDRKDDAPPAAGTYPSGALTPPERGWRFDPSPGSRTRAQHGP